MSLNVKKQLLLYGLAFAALTGLLRWMEYRFLITSHALEIYGGLIAVVFILVGIWAGRKLTREKTKTVVVEKEVVVEREVLVEKEIFVEKEVRIPVEMQATFEPNISEMEKRGISSREMEVLLLVAEGLSNQQIADRLFVSLNTVKTHTSNLFLKLDVSRRTQAVQKAKELRLIA